MGTLDAHLVALERKSGDVIWDVAVGDLNKANAITLAPLVVKNKVIVGVAGGDFSSRGYIDAYDADTGKKGDETRRRNKPQAAGGHDQESGYDPALVSQFARQPAGGYGHQEITEVMRKLNPR